MRPFLLASLVLTWSAGGSLAQICGTTSATPLRVDTLAGVGALLGAVNCTDGGTVEAVWAGAITLDEPISVGSGTFLSIAGEDALAEVQGGSQVRLFDVSPSGGLALAQLKLSGGTAESGGAIFSIAASVSIYGCLFEGNAASNGDGGAVSAKGGELTIVGGEFVGNSATRNGGAVWASEAGLVVREGTRFERNTAAEGGGLFCDVAENATEVASGAAPSCSFSDVVFAFNSATLSGGAIYGGQDSFMAIDDCTFENNTTPGNGGAVVAASATLGGDTLVTNNVAEGSGGGVFGRYATGAIEFNEVVCSQNIAGKNGGCFLSAGRGIVTNGTTMQDNVADNGGCIYAGGESDTVVDGGEFTGCRSIGNGAFMFASDGAVVAILAGTVKASVAERRAGVVYCAGNSDTLGGSKVTIEGGTFSNNTALEVGGAIVAWGSNDGGPTSMLVNVKGGIFVNNTATFYGGFVFLEEQASLSCEGAVVLGNSAGDQGGGIYARDAKWVNSTCDLIGNRAPVGAAAYLTHTVQAANFENHSITDSLAVGGSAVYAAETSVFAKEVDFQSDAGLQEVSFGRAVQLEGVATLVAKGCVFGGWVGDVVVQSASPMNGSLVLDSCDFSKSSAAMMVSSPNSDAEIRNAFVGDLTIENADIVDGAFVLVDRAISCDDPGACGVGGCVDSVLGVLCECLEGGDCLRDGDTLSVELKTLPPSVTYYPDSVEFELLISAAVEGTTSAIWELVFEADSLTIQALPSSGVLPPGKDVTVNVTGSPLREDVGGKQEIRFEVSSVSSGTSDSTTVGANFYLCRSFEYAMPEDDGGITCEQCVVISGAEGVDCELPGATLASLPIRPGFWRSSSESLVVHSCLHFAACTGATRVSSSDDYCQEGYTGPYCAVCTDGYGTGADSACYSCTDVEARWLISAGSLFTLMALLFLIVAVAFLVGGLDAVEEMRRSVARRRGPSLVSLAPRVRESSFPVRKKSISTRSSGRDLLADDPVAPAVNARGTGHSDMPAEASLDVGICKREPTQSQYTAAASPEVGGSVAPGCCGFGAKLKRWASRVPLTKIKILLVIWQILTVFPSISSVDFPPFYSQFLSWIDFVNFDIGAIVSASCILPGVSFYHRLLLTTLAPLALALVLVLTFQMAKSRAGIGSAGVIARTVAWSRHMAAGLLLTFLVFTSTSTIVFKTFACDEGVVEGESYLRADYSLSCHSNVHIWFMVYAGIMIVVYPVGIPLLYAYILWTNRDSLNPRVQTDANAGEQLDVSSGSAFAFLTKKDYLTKESMEELNERLEKRRKNPNLVPSMFLWKDFGPSMYYFEVIDCGRRILLTGMLIFIQPNTPEQAAVACMFAFASLVGFELLRPHLDPVDSWIYRLGCVVIFLSNFLALLIKVDSAGGQQTFLGSILVAVNVLLFLAVLLATWFATQQAVDEHRGGENAVAMAGTMLTFELQAAASSRSMRQQATAPISSTAAGTDIELLL